MKITKMFVLIAAGAIFSVITQKVNSQSINENDVCYSCIGTNYYHPSPSRKEALVDNETAAFCFNPKTLKISLLTEGVRGAYDLIKQSPETSVSPRYFHWLSKETDRWAGYNEQLQVFVEFSEVKNQIQVVKRVNDMQPRVAYNGVCRESRRIP